MTAPSFDVAREFSTEPPGPEGERLGNEISELFVDLADFLTTNLPGGRLKSLTMTNLQQAFLFAVRSAHLDTEEDSNAE